MNDPERGERERTDRQTECGHMAAMSLLPYSFFSLSGKWFPGGMFATVMARNDYYICTKNWEGRRVPVPWWKENKGYVKDEANAFIYIYVGEVHCLAGGVCLFPQRRLWPFLRYHRAAELLWIGNESKQCTIVVFSFCIASYGCAGKKCVCVGSNPALWQTKIAALIGRQYTTSISHAWCRIW